MGMNRILAATDFSGRSERAIERAALLCRDHAAELCLLHVVDDDQPAEVVRRGSLQAEALLTGRAEALRGVVATMPATLVRAGDPFQEIARTAAAESIDLVVMGAHRKSILRDIFMGTTIERVIRTGDRPVLMVNTPPARDYRRVVVAIDLSPASQNAMRTANKLGFLDAAAVTVLHAFDALAKSMMAYASVERDKVEEYVADQAADERRAVSDFVSALDLGELIYALRLDDATPYAAIRSIVEKERPDLLVIGTRGLTGIKRLLLGSVADPVLSGIDCDILAVPPPQ